MIKNTKAFLRLKKEQQKILNYTVLICHAIPNLKKTIKGVEHQIPDYGIPDPDYYNKSNIQLLKSLTRNYKLDTAKYTLISIFSFLEFYFKSVIEELIEFHGGKDNFIKNTHERHKLLISKSEEQNIKSSKKKLQEYYSGNKKEKYEKYIKILNQNANYRNPGEYMATLGLKYLIELISGSNFRSAIIPEMLEYGFGLDMSEKVNKHSDLVDKNLKETFEIMRNLRNQISHGDVSNIGFEKVMDLIRFQRYFSVKIDKHLCTNFFVIENTPK